MFTITARRTAAVLAGALLTLTASPALAAEDEPAATTHAGVVAGYDGAVAGYSATIESFAIEGGDVVQALCVQYGIALNETSDYVVVPRSQGPDGAGRAAWVGANHTSVGTPLEDANLEAVAVQAAAWSFTDGVTYDESNLDNTAARERVAELVAAAGSIAARTSDFDLAVEVSRDGNAVVAEATLLGDGTPLGDQEVTFTLAGAAEGELVATTDASGKARVTAPGVDGEGAVTATYHGVLAAGTLIRPVESGQMFVTTQDANITRTARDSFAAAPAPEPEPTEDPTPDVVDDPAPGDNEDPLPAPDPEPEPEPAADPEPEPEPAADEPEELPYTGPEDALLPLAILAALGAAAYGWRLRRQAG